jgi:hypothetical protein
VVNKVIGINGKPFDASEFDDENRKAVERIIFNLADDIDTGGLIPRGIAFMVMQDDGTPSFYFGGKETDTFALYGAMEAMKTTFWETVIIDGRYAEDG